MTTVALVLAGGSGTRMTRDGTVAASDNKVHLRLAGRSILERSLAVFEAAPRVDRVVLVIRAGDEAPTAAAVAAAAPNTVSDVTFGGATRTASERAGLAVVADDIRSGRVSLIAIHDAARPFVSQALLTELLTTAARVGGAVPAIGIGSRHLVRGGTRPGLVAGAQLRRVQTPQVFQAAPLLAAYERAGTHADGRDTAEIVQRNGDLPVAAVAGDPRNLKLTVATDLAVAERLVADWDADPTA